MSLKTDFWLVVFVVGYLIVRFLSIGERVYTTMKYHYVKLKKKQYQLFK